MTNHSNCLEKKGKKEELRGRSSNEDQRKRGKKGGWFATRHREETEIMGDLCQTETFSLSLDSNYPHTRQRNIDTSPHQTSSKEIGGEKKFKGIAYIEDQVKRKN